MNSRYLFHGKRIDNGEWVTGYYYRNGDGRCFMYVPYLRTFDTYEVVPATIGQCTSLSAAKSYRGDNPEDLLIYEGDIIGLEAEDGETVHAVCEFGTARRQIFEHEVDITGFYFRRLDNDRKTFPISQNYAGKHDLELFRIVGTIHDQREAGM